MQREEYIKKYFTEIELDKNHPDWYFVRKSILSFIEANINLFKGKLLDVGCGIMPYREKILSKGNVNTYIGLDFESSIHTEYSMGKPDLFWNGETIPMDDSSIDTVLATEFFEHCPYPENVLNEISRVLKPNGTLILTVPFLWNLHIIPYDEYRYTPYSLLRHLKNTGFNNSKLTALGGMDASLAQMLGIWLKNRPMSDLNRKIASSIILPIIKKLVTKDKAFNKDELFYNGSMITGLGGVCYK